MKSTTSYRPWLFRFALLTAAATLGLIGIGGLVTSHGAGMAVPDWPTTYGYNMFLFPISQWVGGIFYEHSHRLFASLVGLLTTILAVWLFFAENRRWVKWLGLTAFLLVVFQGVLGGLRVVWLKDEIGIFHATIAQLFLLLVSALALFTSRWWREREAAHDFGVMTTRLRAFLTGTTLLILVQLILGATMRHQHAGLAVPDFPLAYGKIWPDMDETSVEQINLSRLDVRDYAPITPFQIGLHMTHRVGALLIVMAVGMVALLSSRAPFRGTGWSRMSKVWLGLILIQALLGAATVWSNKAADMATLHVLLGATSLALGGLLSIVSCKISIAEPRPLLHSPPSPTRTPVDDAKSAVAFKTM